MIIPAAMFLEMALESLKNQDKAVVQYELKELHALGDPRVQAIGASGVSVDLERGYVLGLQVARILLTMRPGIELARKIAKVESPIGSDAWLNEVSAMISDTFRDTL